MTLLDENQLPPHDPAGRGIARRLYDSVKEAPIISPHASGVNDTSFATAIVAHDLAYGLAKKAYKL